MEEEHKGIHPIQTIKEKGREGKQKIKGMVIRRKDDMITALEKNWRDWALRPLTALFRILGIRANLVTSVGFILIAWAVWLHFTGGSLLSQFIFLVLAAVSDAIDGPTARNNDDVTVLGTWLDHLRDLFLIVWSTYLIYRYNLLSGEILIVVWALEVLLGWLSIKDLVLRYLQGMSPAQSDAVLDQFSLDNLQASVIGRLQFFCWTVSYGSLFLFLFIPSPAFLTIGQALIILEIIFAALNISDAYQKKLDDVA